MPKSWHAEIDKVRLAKPATPVKVNSSSGNYDTARVVGKALARGVAQEIGREIGREIWDNVVDSSTYSNSFSC